MVRNNLYFVSITLYYVCDIFIFHFYFCSLSYAIIIFYFLFFIICVWNLQLMSMVSIISVDYTPITAISYISLIVTSCFYSILFYSILFYSNLCSSFTRFDDVFSVASGISCPALSASLAYYDSYRRAKSPANLTQAQRDFFGAHTYNRTDREGVFHTLWTEANSAAKKTWLWIILLHLLHCILFL